MYTAVGKQQLAKLIDIIRPANFFERWLGARALVGNWPHFVHFFENEADHAETLKLIENLLYSKNLIEAERNSDTLLLKLDDMDMKIWKNVKIKDSSYMVGFVGKYRLGKLYQYANDSKKMSEIKKQNKEMQQRSDELGKLQEEATEIDKAREDEQLVDRELEQDKQKMQKLKNRQSA